MTVGQPRGLRGGRRSAISGRSLGTPSFGRDKATADSFVAMIPDHSRAQLDQEETFRQRLDLRRTMRTSRAATVALPLLWVSATTAAEAIDSARWLVGVRVDDTGPAGDARGLLPDARGA